MDCQHCGQPAHWNYTEVVGGQKSSVPLCASCARQRGLVGDVPSAPPPPSGPTTIQVTQVTATFGPSPVIPEALPTAPRRCDRCGTTLAAVRKSGRVGCPACYDAFRTHLEPLLRRVHGCSRHRAVHGEQSRQLEDLRADLNRAVQAEDFEAAARLRDRITQVQRGHSGSEPTS